MFKKIVIKYTDSMGALRSLLELERSYDKQIDEAIKKDPISFLPQIIKALEREKELLDNSKDGVKFKTNLQKKIDSLKIVLDKYYNYKIDSKGKIIIISPRKKEQLSKFIDLFKYMNSKSYQKGYIKTSCLMNLMSIFEILIKNIIYKVDEYNPHAVNLDDKTLTYADLKNAGTIEEAKKILIENFVDTNLRKSKSEWFNFLETISGTKIDIDEYINQFVEIVERRNIYTHNDGRVNSYYLNTVSREYIELYKAKKNEKLVTDFQYLSSAIDLFETLGVHLIFKIWKKYDEKNVERGNILNGDVVYPALLKKRYFVSQHIAEDVLHDKYAKEIIHDMAQLNYWFSIKESGEYDKIKNDIMSADYSSKNRRLQLGLLALQENEGKFIPLLKESFRLKDITLEEYEKFPIFNKMRNTKNLKNQFLNRKSIEI